MSPTPAIAYLLAENEAALALDRKMLRHLGVSNIVFFPSGGNVLDQFKTNVPPARAASGSAPFIQPDILIMAERLEDMTGLQFLAHIRASAFNPTIPALLLVSNATSDIARAARASKSCAVLARPYSPEQALEALRRASDPQYRAAPLVLPPSFISELRARKNRSGETPILRRDAQPRSSFPGETSLREGLKALQRGDKGTAATLLHGSYDADPGRVETCLALSKLYSLQHQENMEFTWLCRAIVLCLKRGEKVRAQDILARLPRGKEGQAPLLAEAGLALQVGEIKAAALAFLEAHRLDPSQQLHTLIGRTCMFTPAPEEHMRELVKALEKTGHAATANKLHWRLLPPPKEEETGRRSFLDNFPLLNDIVSVAAHTIKTWRHAA